MDIPFVELPFGNKRVNVSVKECHITLYDRYLIYKIIANYSSVDNPEVVLKDYKCNNSRVWMRQDIAMVEMFKDNNHGTWAVGIKFIGTDGPEWDFENVTPAKELYQSLTEYFVNR